MKNHPLRRVFSEKSLEVYLVLQKEIDRCCFDGTEEEHEAFFQKRLEELGLQYPQNKNATIRKAEAFGLIAQEMRRNA